MWARLWGIFSNWESSMLLNSYLHVDHYCDLESETPNPQVKHYYRQIKISAWFQKLHEACYVKHRSQQGQQNSHKNLQM